jgi:tRNA (guanosine-2'-O-)-methyltransferase
MTNDYTKALISYFETLVTPQKLQRMHEVLAQRTRHVALVLEESYHDSNVSAMLRSAECFGVQDVYMIESRNRTEFKVGVARGSDQWLSLHRYEQADAATQCLKDLKDQGYLIVATVPDTNALPIDNLPLDKPIALVFGNERLGISNEVRQQANVFVTIPMVGFTESLNVSVAAATIMYDVVHRLKKSEHAWQLSDEEKELLKLHWMRNIINASEEHEQRFLEMYNK